MRQWPGGINCSQRCGAFGQFQKLQKCQLHLLCIFIHILVSSQIISWNLSPVKRASDVLTWLVEVRPPKTHLKPWLLITDWPVEDAGSAVRIFRMYRQRWAVEESFKFTKHTLGWEEVQLLDLEGIRTLVALGWVVAGFLYELGVTLAWEEVQLLARLGGWVPRKDRRPGKITLVRGLRRLLDTIATHSFLDLYAAEHGHLPPRIAAMLRHAPPPQL